MMMGLGPTKTGAPSGGGGGTPPINTDSPSLSGVESLNFVGDILTVTDGTWDENGGGAITFSYAWYANGVLLEDSVNEPTRTLLQQDEDKEIVCRVTATNSGGAAFANSVAVLVNRTMTYHGTEAYDTWSLIVNWSDNNGVASRLPGGNERLTFTAPAHSPDLTGLYFPTVTVTGGGDLDLANPQIGTLDFDGGFFTGSIASFDSAVFRGYSVNSVELPTNGATFNDNAENRAVLTYAVFNNNAKNGDGGVVGSLATFTGNSQNLADGVVTGTSTFSDSAQNHGLLDASTFYGGRNYGIIGGSVNVHYPTEYPFDLFGGSVGGDTNYIGYIFGCTDPGATNFDPDANSDNGGCMYDAPPSAPGNFSMVSVNPNGMDALDIEWGSSAGANIYTVYLYDPSDNLVNSLSEAGTSVYGAFSGSFSPSGTYKVAVEATNDHGTTAWNDGLVGVNM